MIGRPAVSLARRGRLAAVLAAASVLAVGCGDDEPKPTAGSPAPSAPPAASPGGSAGPSGSTSPEPTGPPEQVAAAKINLGTQDVQGTQAANDKVSPACQKARADLEACIGGAPPAAQVAEVPGQELNRIVQQSLHQASSRVVVFKDPQAAAAELEAFRAPKAADCLAKAYAALLKADTDGSITFTPKGTAPLTLPEGVDGTGTRITYDAMVDKAKVPFVVDVATFAEKRSLVQMITLASGGPFPDADREAALRALQERAKQNAL